MIPGLRGRVAAMIIVCLCLVSARAEEPLGSIPRRGLLLLQNGEVLSGEVALIGDTYHVTVRGGGIRVPQRDAELFCRDLEEGYQLKRGRLTPGKAAERLALSEWCLRHGMTGYAADELAEAIALNPQHPRIPLLERRIKLAVSQPKPPRPEREPLPAAPSNEDLDRLVHSLPPGTMETFTTTIQPLLLNHCSTGGCHGPNSKDPLRLVRTPSSKPPTRRLTQRNLAETLKLLNREHPEQSPLLIQALQPHGTTKAAPLPQRDLGQVRQFENWVLRVAAGREPARPASVSDALPLLQARRSIQPPSGEGEATSDDKAEHADAALEDNSISPAEGPEAPPPGTAAPDSQPPALSAGEHRPTPRGRPRARRPLPPGRSTDQPNPMDPFDPEIFNRRFHADEPAAP